jgi:hypothetical protein
MAGVVAIPMATASSEVANTGTPQATLPVAVANPQSLTPEDVEAARTYMADTLAKGHIQTHFDQSPPPNAFLSDILKKISEFFSDVFTVISDFLEPIAPILPWLLYLGLAILVGFLLSPLVRAAIATRFERFFPRDQLKADIPWRPSAQAAAALLEEIDALALKGEFDEAVHLLLKRSVADLNAYRPDLVRKHFSARDIGLHPLLPSDARPAFAEITKWAEKSYFAGLKVGRAGFDACRKAYSDFVTAEPLKAGGKS